MDNKRVYKRISTIFWFLFATLPVWVALFGFIGQYIGGIPDSSFISNPLDAQFGKFYRGFNYFLEQSIYTFVDYIPSFLNDLFVNLWNLIDNVRYEDGEILYTIIYFMSWFTWVYFVELIVDFIVWLPRWFHNILEKGIEKVS